MSPEDAYLGDRVKTLMVGLLKLSANSNFVSLVNEEVAAQFDDDDNVLFTRLKEVAANNNLDLAALLQQSISNKNSSLPSSEHSYNGYSCLTSKSDIESIIAGFTWNGDHYFLQIYIPFVDSVNLTERPVICFGHQEVETTIGYRLNSNGSVSVIAIDENYAKEHLVWVVSVNEVVDKYGKLDGLAANNSSNELGNGYVKSLGRSAEIHSVAINDLKESWIKGKAEVAIAAYILNSNCSYRKIMPLGCMVKISKNNLNQWIQVNPSDPNIVIFADGYPSNPLADNERLAIELYEKDASNKRTYIPCAGIDPYNYKSIDAPYGSIIYNASSLQANTIPQVNEITSWGPNYGMRILSRIWN